MTLALLLLALAATPPAPAAKAKSLASAADWDALYLAFASGDPKAYSRADRRAIGAALEAGAKAMTSKDAVMATSLAERAVAFDPRPDLLLAAAALEEQVQQDGQAAKFLDRAVELAPRSGPAHLARAELALEENDAQLALTHLKAVPRTFQKAKVRALESKARAAIARKQAAQVELVRMQVQVAKEERTARNIADTPSTPGLGGRADPLRGAKEAGLRESADAHFYFAYGNNQRDWGQRADYEDRVARALEEAYEFVGEVMHTNRTQKVGVVLYTKEEFNFHFGGSELSRAAGFYSGKIRINDAEEISPDVRATIVHEYTHAVLDELAHGGQHIPMWVNEGFATYVDGLYRERQSLRSDAQGWGVDVHGLAKAGAFPKLETLNRGFLSYRNPPLAYIAACEAVTLMVQRYGMGTFVQAVRDSATQPWDALFKERFNGDLSKLDDDVQSELAD